ncbi:hypothetical protein ARMGADRAFT_1036177 [Armillaria gallica]|uniref:Uncharacterized protein n=1 Tax=Armillaria gallica TaxID=47427 RepID=A0A2H3CV88_ARMGA|nr:hypothetical protein ARMGADRAFT_1036177 [Armillaria gallica]
MTGYGFRSNAGGDVGEDGRKQPWSLEFKLAPVAFGVLQSATAVLTPSVSISWIPSSTNITLSTDSPSTDAPLSSLIAGRNVVCATNHSSLPFRLPSANNQIVRICVEPPQKTPGVAPQNMSGVVASSLPTRCGQQRAPPLALTTKGVLILGFRFHAVTNLMKMANIEKSLSGFW